jgi:flagellar FliJ protein
MANPTALHTLIELANKDADEAARLLGIALRAGEDAMQKLDLLIQYRDDYAARCQSNLATGISTTHFNNFQVFMQKLDHAIVGQQKVVSDAEHRVALARTAWQTCELKKMSFVTLAGRADRETQRRDAWREQKQNDEFATRSAQHKPTTS